MTRFAYIIILLIVGTYCDAQAIPWILLGRSKVAFEERDISLSLELILEAVEAMDDYPEAEYWLGKVYAAQGQTLLAEQQYRRALYLAIYLRIPEDKFMISYSLAELLLDMGASRRDEAEIILAEIANTEGASSLEEIEEEHRYVELLTHHGLDELLYLYRAELHQSLKARRMLGEMAWEDGRYRSSLLHSVRTVLALLSTVSAQYRRYKQNWRFDIDQGEDFKFPDRDVRYPGDIDGVADLYKLLEDEFPTHLQWLENSGFWPVLYLLSVSLYAEGYLEQAESLWHFMAPGDIPREQAGQWGILASHQLEKPFISIGSLGP